MSETKQGVQRNWLALYTKPKQEQKAELQIERYGIQVYLPMITRLSKWSDRTKKIREPLIKGYIFVYANEKERLQALENPSVVRCLLENGRPAVIPEYQIDNLKHFVKEEFEYKIVNAITPGMRVRIKSGAFKDVTGVIVQENGNNALAVSIELLNRTVLSYLSDLSIVEPLD